MSPFFFEPDAVSCRPGQVNGERLAETGTISRWSGLAEAAARAREVRVIMAIEHSKKPSTPAINCISK